MNTESGTLQRIERLAHSLDFRRVFRRGKCFRDPALRVHYLQVDLECSRLGLVVSRKVGNAVVRNRVKRRLRTVFRQNKHRIPGTLDLVLVAEPRHGPATLEEYRQIFDRFLEDLRARGRGSSRKKTRRGEKGPGDQVTGPLSHN